MQFTIVQRRHLALLTRSSVRFDGGAPGGELVMDRECAAQCVRVLTGKSDVSGILLQLFPCGSQRIGAASFPALLQEADILTYSERLLLDSAWQQWMGTLAATLGTTATRRQWGPPSLRQSAAPAQAARAGGLSHAPEQPAPPLQTLAVVPATDLSSDAVAELPGELGPRVLAEIRRVRPRTRDEYEMMSTSQHIDLLMLRDQHVEMATGAIQSLARTSK
eukprot:7121582-Pyramimonas_sp.AAC.2